jgi:hypothetical protein
MTTPATPFPIILGGCRSLPPSKPAESGEACERAAAGWSVRAEGRSAYGAFGAAVLAEPQSVSGVVLPGAKRHVQMRRTPLYIAHRSVSK